MWTPGQTFSSRCWLSLAEFAGLLDEIERRNRGGLQAVTVREVFIELRQREGGFFRRHADAASAAREECELFESISLIDAVTRAG